MQAYHGVLQKLGVKPQRSLEDDMKLQTNVMNYGGNGKVVSALPAAPQAAANGKAKADCGCGCKGASTARRRRRQPTAMPRKSISRR